MLNSAARFLFGDDIFISYSRADGAAYAAALANELSSKRLYCRFDQWGTVPGEKVPEEILAALKRTGTLIVVATEKAYESHSVEQEIREFLPTKRLIIPIDLSGRIFSAPWWSLLAGLPVSKDLQSGSPAQVMVLDHADDQATAGPSAEVLSRIYNSISFTRKDKRLRQAAASALVLVAVFLIGAVIAAKVAASKSLEAGNQSRLANEAIANRKTAEIKLEEATRQAEEQYNLAKSADEQRRNAETQAALARQRTRDAVRQRLQAESLKKRADLLTKARMTLDSRDPLAAMEPINQSLKLADGPDGRLLLAEAYNDGIPDLLPRIFTQIRQFRLCPSDNKRFVAIGFTDERLPGHNQIAYVDLKTNVTRISREFLFLSATFSADGKNIYVVAVTKYERGPDAGMDTKISQEVSLLKYDLELHLEQRIPLDTIRGPHKNGPVDSVANWNIRDIQDLRASPSGDRLIMAGYASQSYMANVSNPTPFHLRSWVSLVDGAVSHSLDTEHELSSFNQYRGRVVLVDNSHIVVDGVREVYEVDLRTGTRVLLGNHTGSVEDLAANATGDIVAAIGSDNRVTIFRRAADQWKASVETLQGDASCDRIVFFDDDKIAVARGNGNVSLLWLASTFDDESLHLEGDLVWRTGREKTLAGHTARISVLTVSPDGRWIATGSEDKTVRLWSPYEHANRVLYGSKRGVTDVRFSSDSKSVYVSDSDGLLRMFTAEDEHIFSLSVEPGSKRHEELVPDAAWDEGGGLTQAILREHLGFVRDISERADGHLIAYTYDRRRTEWDGRRQLLSTVQFPPETLADSENPSESKISTAVSQETADADRNAGRRLNRDSQWADTLDGRFLRLHSLPLPAKAKDKREQEETAGVFSPDGKWFLQFDYKKQYLRIWRTIYPNSPAASLEIVYGTFHRNYYGGPDSATHVRFSNRGAYAAFPIQFDGEAICVIDLADFGVRIFRQDLVEGAFDLSDDGNLVAAGRTGEVYIHNIRADTTSIMEKHGRYVSSVAISSDGLWVASGSRDRSVRLWSVVSGEYYEFRVQNPVERVLFSSDDTELLAAAGRSIHSWYVPSGPDPLGHIQPISYSATESNSRQRLKVERQADNLAILVHEGSEPSRRNLIEFSLGRRVELTAEHKRNLLDLLSSTDQPEHSRVRAALELSCFGPSVLEDVAEISTQLRSANPGDDPVVNAVVSLLKAAGPFVEDDLRSELARASDANLSNGILYALGVLFGSSDSTRMDLHRHLSDNNMMTRTTAALMLNIEGKDDASIPVLADALGSGNAKEEQAAKALEQYGAAAVDDLLRVLGSEKRSSYRDTDSLIRKTLVGIGAPAIPSLLVALKNTHGNQLAEVVTTLGEIGPPAAVAVEPLIDLVSSQTGENRSQVLYALASIGPNSGRVIDFLIGSILTGSEPLVAVFTVKRTSALKAVPRLRKALYGASASSSATKYLAMALGAFGVEASEAVPDLITALASNSYENAAADEIVEALGKIGPNARDAGPLLLKRLKESSGFEKTHVLEALGKIHADADRTIPGIIEAVRQECRVEDLRRFRITSAALEEMAKNGVSQDVARNLERLDDAIGRPEGLFSTLVMREIGVSNWNAFRNQILAAALDSTPFECDEYGIFGSAFDAIAEFDERAKTFVPEVEGLRELFGGCRNASSSIDATLKRIQEHHGDE